MQRITENETNSILKNMSYPEYARIWSLFQFLKDS